MLCRQAPEGVCTPHLLLLLPLLICACTFSL
jgi:hypothetical protein